MCEVKTIACEAAFKFRSNLNVFKGVVIIYQELQHSHLLSLQLNVPDKTFPYSALDKRDWVVDAYFVLI